MDCNQAISEFQCLLTNINPTFSRDFILWLRNNIDNFFQEADKQNPDNADVMIEAIRDDIRNTLPVDALSPTENILVPDQGPNSDCSPDTTVHVDAFLYDDDNIDELCDEGKMSKNYCRQCGSRNIQPLTFITHSASVKQIKYIYNHLLPDLSGRTVVDVGSRTGAMFVWCKFSIDHCGSVHNTLTLDVKAYLYSGANGIIGIEIDSTFCQLQQKILKNYGMEDRVKVFHQDVKNCQELLQSADVVILNNVFEFFMSREEQIIIWQFIRQSLKKPGTFLVTIPSIHESLENLQVNADVSCWLRPLDVSEVCRKANLLLFGDEEQEDKTLESIHLYEVQLTSS